MRTIFTITMMFFSLSAMACKSSLLDHNFRKLASSEEVNLCEAYSGKVLLIVNTASKCGFTYQYEGLEKLHDEYSDEGLMVLGFPSNDFLGQEPGTEEEIQDFCRLTYGVEFPMFEKITVKEGIAHPFYNDLANSAGTHPKWNFHKYLIGRDGSLQGSFSSMVSTESSKLRNKITQLLKNKI